MTDPKPTKKGKLVRLLVPIVGVLVVGAGGAAGGVYAASSGLLGGAGAAPAHPEPEQQHYYAIEQPFTVNLRGSQSFVQVALAVSGDDEKMVEAVKANEPAMRSVALQVIAEQSYDDLVGVEGRRKLLKSLQRAMDAELRAKVGNGGIDNVYFTTFVMQ